MSEGYDLVIISAFPSQPFKNNFFKFLPLLNWCQHYTNSWTMALGCCVPIPPPLQPARSPGRFKFLPYLSPIFFSSPELGSPGMDVASRGYRPLRCHPSHPPEVWCSARHQFLSLELESFYFLLCFKVSAGPDAGGGGGVSAGLGSVSLGAGMRGGGRATSRPRGARGYWPAGPTASETWESGVPGTDLAGGSEPRNVTYL